MGVGLGKNSPVILSFTRENYEALIDRHGQWIRWRVASKCACVNAHTYQPDIHCKKCGGRGYTYSYQKKQIIQTVIMAREHNHHLILDDEYINDELIKVYDRNGIELKAEKFDSYIHVDNILTKGVYYNIVLQRDNENILDEGVLIKDTGGYFILPELAVSKSNIDGIYYNAPCDIVECGKIIDAEENEFEVAEFRLNKILLKEKWSEPEEEGEEPELLVPIEPIRIQNVKYIKPFIFALLNQNLSKGDQQVMVDAQGDAVCSYPYNCDVSEQDVLTVLAGTVTKKEIIARTADKQDKLPSFFVESIVSVIGSDGIEYTEGEDFVLIGTNAIKWLIEDGPDEGEGYSVTYKTYPSYTVVKDIPQLRSSENQRFPKKAVVKYMASYSEQKKVNRQ